VNERRVRFTETADRHVKDAQTPVLHLRRFYLPKLTYHLYYTFDDDEVVVRALWGARREHGPQF
jgi:hypothetical protein